MARRETRSPSPAGSSYSSSKRSRRDHDRYTRDRRDDDRARDRRYRDHDSRRRRDASVERRNDRRDDNVYRPPRRDRSRERRRSRSPAAGRHRSRDYRERRDDSRDHDRRRRDGSADYRRRQRTENGRDKSHGEAKSPPKAVDAERKKAERVAKLEAWKAKQQQKMKEAQSAGGARSILEEMDKRAMASPAAPSPASPAPASGSASPAVYGGKFDPKAIAKRASAGQTPAAALGNDVAVPSNQKPVPGLNPSVGATTNTSAAGTASAPGKSRARPLKTSGILSGFGLNKTNDTEKKRGLDFEDEESSRKKLEKLPTPPLEDALNDADPAVAEEDGDDVDMDEAGSEEEALAAARAAAEKREQLILSQSNEAQTNEVQMAEAPDEDQANDEEDPLDAYMAGLTDPGPNSLRHRGKGKQTEPEAMFGDDGAADDLDVVDANPDDILSMASKKKKRDIPTVDHSKFEYEPFRKNFYMEPSELADMTEEELADLRLELDGIKVRGVDVPKPVTKWAQCGLGVQVLDVIRSLGYERPTSIQSQAIPAIMSGRDVIGVAKTGSGKTVAFLLPMFRQIKDQRPLDALDGPIALVMSPTRELATQIHKDCKPFLKALNLRAACCYGGAPIKDQIADLKRGAEILVCTPGRMIELLSANSGRVTNLRRVTYIVLDEADRMFDMGFEPQVMKIIGNVRPDRQTVLFSATFPRNMEALARKTLIKPIEIIVGGRSVVAPEITQIVEVRAESTKFFRLLELLGELYDKDEDARTLIFVDRQEAADGLLRELMRKGYPCNSIHGGKDQIDRDSTIDDFKAGVIPIMIATSVAARGLDVKQLKLVVNYDAPNHLEDYVHRAGRTGRAGNKGTAVTFVTEEQDRYAVDIVKALKASSQPVPEELQKLADGFLDKVKSGKAKASGSGFGGKGLDRLDQERDAARNRERKTYRTGDEPEDDDKEEIKDEDIIAKAMGGSTAIAATSLSGAGASAAPTLAAGSSLAVQRGLDEANIVVHKTELPAKTEGSGSGPAAGSKNKLDMVRAAVASIGDRLNKRNQLNPGHPIDNKGPDAGAFHSTLEINDFPQKARWAVTNRTNVAKILDATGTSITTKGNFYAAGKEPGPGEMPKLYILVEGDTEVVVITAMRELIRLLKEGTMAAADVESRAPASGRYSVV